MADKRINDLPETSTPSSSDMVAIDGASSRKVQLQNMGFALTDMSNVSQGDVSALGLAEVDFSNVDLDTAIPQSTESVRGTMETSSQSETSDGTDNTTSITPLRLEQKLAEVGITESVFMDGYIKGLLPKYISTNTNRLQAGKCRDAGNNTNITLDTAIDKILLSGWVLGDGNGLASPVLKTGTFDATGTSIVGAGTSFITELKVGTPLYSDTLGQARLVSRVDVDLTGTLTTNGINVNGSGTLFLSETTIGEQIYDSSTGEGKTIVNIVSDTAIELATGFDTDLSSVAAKKRTETDCEIETAFSSDFIDEDFYVGGVVANATYHMFVLSDGVGGVDCGYDWDVDATNLTAESGYSAYRRVGSFITDSSGDIINFKTIESGCGGIEVRYGGGITDFTVVGNVSPSWQTLILSKPLGITTKAIVFFSAWVYSGTRLDTKIRDTFVGVERQPLGLKLGDSQSGSEWISEFEMPTNGSNEMDIFVNLEVGGSYSGAVESLGYIDERV
jgi:hypothetical protein